MKEKGGYIPPPFTRAVNVGASPPNFEALPSPLIYVTYNLYTYIIVGTDTRPRCTGMYVMCL
jgi:hypothetical protein